MGLLGKMVGGTIGFALGGPLGAAAGAAVGHLFDSQAPGPSSLDRSYAVLGCKKTDTDGQIRRKYHRLALRFHPDIIASKGLAEDLVRAAEKRFREVCEAYETVKRERNLS